MKECVTSVVFIGMLPALLDTQLMISGFNPPCSLFPSPLNLFRAKFMFMHWKSVFWKEKQHLNTNGMNFRKATLVSAYIHLRRKLVTFFTSCTDMYWLILDLFCTVLELRLKLQNTILRKSTNTGCRCSCAKTLTNKWQSQTCFYWDLGK